MPQTIPLHDNEAWQHSLADLIDDPAELLEMLGLDAAKLGLSDAALNEFPLRVPRPYAARIERGNPADPLLLQVLPQAREMQEIAGYSLDPLGENRVNPVPGLLHKYHGRALLLVTSACAIHCRYCFRRHFPYQDNRPGRLDWEQSLDYLAGDPGIHEVILSGGDPLAVSDRQLGWLLNKLTAIKHIRRIRLHTRLPVMIPSRITAELCRLLQSSTLQTVIVLHSNHPRELDVDVGIACQRMREAGFMLLNQSVLLKGINDDADTLSELSERLFAIGVLPYYLHMLDRVRGSAHFEVPLPRARALVAGLRRTLPGYLVPSLVREEAGAAGKTPLL